MAGIHRLNPLAQQHPGIKQAALAIYNGKVSQRRQFRHKPAYRAVGHTSVECDIAVGSA